jgi:hypothetical protein
MKTKLTKWILTLFLLTAISACNLPTSQGSATDSYLMKTIIAQNVQLTVLSGDLAATAAQTNTPVSQELVSPTITITPEMIATPTLEALTLTINKNSNCREGPANYYPLVVTLNAGDKVVVLGRNSHGDYFNVRPSGSSNESCWVWANYATLSGNTSGLPVFTAVPGPTLTFTPTPTATQAPTFSGKYISLTSCGAVYSLRFFIQNPSNTTWQSIRISILDNDTSTNFVHSSNTFTSYNGCSVEVSQNDLAKGEEGYVTTFNPGQFGYDPTGHSLTVTITLFSADNQNGTSSSHTYNVTP